MRCRDGDWARYRARADGTDAALGGLVRPQPQEALPISDLHGMPRSGWEALV